MSKQPTPAKQAISLGKGGIAPPEEHQFKPGQSGNPAGPPKRRTQLWVYINQFMELTDAELAKVDRPALTQAQKVALKLVERAAQGKGCDSERLARYCVDRDEGKREPDVEQHSHSISIVIGGRTEAPKRKAIESEVISPERAALHKELRARAVAAGMIEETVEGEGHEQ